MADRKGALPTIEDVARDAGVSPMTVSRVFSGNVPVSNEKREAVLRSAKKLQYVPNRSAQLLAALDSGRATRSRNRSGQHHLNFSPKPSLSWERLGLALMRCFERGRIAPLRQLNTCLASEGLSLPEATRQMADMGLIRVNGDYVVLSERGRTVVARVAESLADIAELVAGLTSTAAETAPNP